MSEGDFENALAIRCGRLYFSKPHSKNNLKNFDFLTLDNAHILVWVLPRDSDAFLENAPDLQGVILYRIFFYKSP